MKRRIVPSVVRLARRVRSHVFKEPPEREVDEELAFHVEMRVREHLRKGLFLDEARRLAEERFGDLEAVKAACRRIAERRERKMRMKTWWDDLRQDVTYAFRQIRRNPGFAAVAVVTLALGIGANTAVFSVVNGVVLRPLPFAEPDRLVQVWTRYLPESGFDIPRFPISVPELLDYREQNASMEAVGYYTTGSRTLTGIDGDPVRLELALVDDALLPILGTRPALGRWIRPEEDEPGVGVVVLSHGLWVDRFGADPGIV
ncbi:MAG TPA: ABC transporter permease, partial [Longimicrobiales bacterium]|nr:ABC transporter permease [Longimicrobiales bacterium]